MPTWLETVADYLGRDLSQPHERQGLPDLLQRLLRHGSLHPVQLPPYGARDTALFSEQELRHHLVLRDRKSFLSLHDGDGDWRDRYTRVKNLRMQVSEPFA